VQELVQVKLALVFEYSADIEHYSTRQVHVSVARTMSYFNNENAMPQVTLRAVIPRLLRLEPRPGTTLVRRS